MWRQLYLPSYEFSANTAADEVTYLEDSGLQTHSADVVASVELRHLRRQASEKERGQLASALESAVRLGQLRRSYDGAYTRPRPGESSLGSGPTPVRGPRPAPTGLPEDYYGDDHFQGASSRFNSNDDDDPINMDPLSSPPTTNRLCSSPAPYNPAGQLDPPAPPGPPGPPYVPGSIGPYGPISPSLPLGPTGLLGTDPLAPLGPLGSPESLGTSGLLSTPYVIGPSGPMGSPNLSDPTDTLVPRDPPGPPGLTGPPDHADYPQSLDSRGTFNQPEGIDHGPQCLPGTLIESSPLEQRKPDDLQDDTLP